jgi:RimJ/RimL family protein N-acetyltransferase
LVSPKRFSYVELAGDKVRLRPVQPEDAPTAYPLARDDRVTRTLSWEGPTSVQELAEYYRGPAMPRQRQDGSLEYSFAIERLGVPGIVGSIGARPRSHPQQIDIGYWLGADFWSQGLMTEAARLATHFSFEHLNAVRVYALVFIGNTGSRRVLEKNGFHHDGTLRSHVQKRGEWLDEWFFSLLRPEWEAQKDRYKPRQEMVVL